MAMGDLDAAADALEQVRDVGSDEPAFQQMQGNWFLASDEPELAIEAFRSLNELDSESLAGWRGLQIAYSQLERPDEAALAEDRLQERQDVQDARNQERWFILVRYASHVTFGILLVGFAVTFVSLKFVWSVARQGWSDV